MTIVLVVGAVGGVVVVTGVACILVPIDAVANVVVGAAAIGIFSDVSITSVRVVIVAGVVVPGGMFSEVSILSDMVVTGSGGVVPRGAARAGTTTVVVGASMEEVAACCGGPAAAGAGAPLFMSGLLSTIALPMRGSGRMSWSTSSATVPTA